MASVIAGIKIRSERLFKTEERPGCAHSIPGKTRFCPECGAPRIIQEEVALFDDDEYEIGGFQVSFSWGGSQRGTWALIGRELASCSNEYYQEEPAEIDLNEIDSTKVDLREVLKPLGLWDNGTLFGLYLEGIIHD